MDLLVLAKSIADRAEAAALKAKVPITVCVIDAHGNVVLKHRMTGALGASSDLAERKAYTAAMTRIRTLDLVPLVQAGQPLAALIGVSGGRYCAMGGGVPIKYAENVIAGVGVSGGTVDQDVAIVESAVLEV
jgi:uncharacterized protein GlcG (DUF336 family)